MREMSRDETTADNGALRRLRMLWHAEFAFIHKWKYFCFELRISSVRNSDMMCELKLFRLVIMTLEIKCDEISIFF